MSRVETGSFQAIVPSGLHMHSFYVEPTVDDCEFMVCAYTRTAVERVIRERNAIKKLPHVLRRVIAFPMHPYEE